jgi:hypothetical protein
MYRTSGSFPTLPTNIALLTPRLATLFSLYARISINTEVYTMVHTDRKSETKSVHFANQNDRPGIPQSLEALLPNVWRWGG